MRSNPSIFVILGLVALTHLSACDKKAEKTTAQNATKTAQTATSAANEPTVVNASLVTLTQQQDVLMLSGTTRARHRAKLTFNISGYLQGRHYNVGDSLK